MSKTVFDYQMDIAKAQEEILKIQQSCAHSSYGLCMYMWRIGSTYATRICNGCRLPLPGITREEEVQARENSYIPLNKVNE